ncbi:MAG: flavin reductase [Pirellulales bacterium]|nr:flavin reductase [Pirellulales bacterium]
MASEILLDGIVGLVLAEHHGELAVQTTASFAEAAHYPASLWVSMERQSPARRLILESQRFTLAVLSDQDRALANQFRAPAVSEAARSRLALYQSESGFWFPNVALTAIGCAVTQSVDVDGSVLIFGDMIESHYDSRRGRRRQLLASELGLP